MTLYAEGLVPARFLTIVAHLTVTIIILWDRDENIKSCLPLEYSSDDYGEKNTELTVGLSVAIGLLGFEILGFLSGMTMFMPSVAMISVAAHASASVLLTYFLIDEWDCNLYWWVFAFCSTLPAFVECVALIAVLGLRRN